MQRAEARRLLTRVLGRYTRRALILLCILQAGGAASESIVSARYVDPTERYAHAVLGDGIEHETLELGLGGGVKRRFTLPADLVFEDTEPRLIDLDADGVPEVIVVESSQRLGARLAVYGPSGRITATPYIGTRFRWLAPVGAADLDGDGRVEIAYVDRPHLAKTLRIWRYDAQKLDELASYTGVTNHRIGELDIAGGIRHCGSYPEIILADREWRHLLALSFDGSAVRSAQIGMDTSRVGFAAALACPE